MESTLAILLRVFLKATNVDFFVYKTTGFIHVADIALIDRFSYFATGHLLIFDEGAGTIRQEICKSLVGLCSQKLHPEFEDLYEHCKVKPSSYATAKILSMVLSNTPFLNQLNSLKRIVKEPNFDRSAALPELPFLTVFYYQISILIVKFCQFHFSVYVPVSTMLLIVMFATETFSGIF